MDICPTCRSNLCDGPGSAWCLLRAHFRLGTVPERPTIQNQLTPPQREHIPHDVVVRGRKRMERIKADLFGSGVTAPCCFCGWQMSYRSATLEHILPVSKGGQTVTANLTLSCDACNGERGARDFDTYRREVQAKRGRR